MLALFTIHFIFIILTIVCRHYILCSSISLSNHHVFWHYCHTFCMNGLEHHILKIPDDHIIYRTLKGLEESDSKSQICFNTQRNISLVSLWNTLFGIIVLTLFLLFFISLSATVIILYRWDFLTLSVQGADFFIVLVANFRLDEHSV